MIINKVLHNSLATNTAPSMTEKLANKFGANTAPLMAEKFKAVPPLLDLSRVAPSRIDFSQVAPSPLKELVESAKANNSPFIER